MPAGGVFFRSTDFMSAPLSAPAFGGASHDALSRAGEILLPAGDPPHFFLREASVLYAFVLIVIVVLFVSNAYAIWYAHTEQYKLDNRLDRVTRR
jgi:hypothetical protein